MSAQQPLLEVEGATKRFGAVAALSDVSLRVARGEIVAVVGDNGAGKSTLIKCVSGAHRLDRGRVSIDGEALELRSPMHARQHGIETVYQDLSLFDNLSVVANLFAGRELTVRGWLRQRAMTSRVLAKLTGFVSSRSSPELGATAPDMTLMSVDLPAPLSPSRQTISPPRTSSDAPSSASTPP